MYVCASQQIKIIQLLAIPHDVPLDLARIHPGDKVLHVAGDQEGRVRDDFRANPDVALFDECGCLLNQVSTFARAYLYIPTSYKRGRDGGRENSQP